VLLAPEEEANALFRDAGLKTLPLPEGEEAALFPPAVAELRLLFRIACAPLRADGLDHPELTLAGKVPP